ncbi:MAG: S8 family peptidase [Bacteroidetes bacterium]|nr:S8 family peptidase [Bacteroidota bacterium]
MKNITFSVLCRGLLLYTLLSYQLFAQLTSISNNNVISEGNFYTNAQGELFCDAVVVKFKENVIDLPAGIRFASLSNIRQEYPSIISHLTELGNLYGNYELIKQIPSAVWGDTIRTNRITGKQVAVHDYSQLFTIRFENPFPLKLVTERLDSLEIIEYVHQPITIAYHVDPPNDPFYVESDPTEVLNQWYLFTIEAQGAWDISQVSENIKVGIVDVGTDQDHPDLINKIAGGDGVEFGDTPTPNYHGTYLAGIVGAETNNLTGIASLGWNIKLNTYGAGLFPEDLPGNLIQDIYDAAAISDIINTSFGTYRRVTVPDILETHPDCPEEHIESWNNSLGPWDYTEIHEALIDAYQEGVILIASNGNSSPNDNNHSPELCDLSFVPVINYPAAYPEVISISGTNKTDNFINGYNYGSFVDASAPGSTILTTNYSSVTPDPGSLKVGLSGTSFSSAMTAALAGLIKSVNSNLTVSQVKGIITTSADKIGQYSYNSSGWNQYMGYGRINAHNALNVTLGKPQKPQGLNVVHYGGYSGNPKVTWFTNPPHPLGVTKFNTKEYDLYRSFEDDGYRSAWEYIATVSHNPGLVKHSYIDAEVTTYRIPQSSIEYFYRVIARSNYKNYESIPSDEDSVYGEGPIGKRSNNEKSPEKIEDFELLVNYPNPFNPVTNIVFSIPNKSFVKLEIFNILGKKIITLVNEEKSAGSHSVEFSTDGFNIIPSGVYFYRIEVFELEGQNKFFTDSKKMVLVK